MTNAIFAHIGGTTHVHAGDVTVIIVSALIVLALMARTFKRS
jgi:hypothetical protein